jgi:hypothetical protein
MVMRFGMRRSSDAGGIDGGEGRGKRLGGSDTGLPSSTARRRRSVDEDEDAAVVEKPATFDDFDEFSDDTDATPDDRRRDPLRKNF